MHKSPHFNTIGQIYHDFKVTKINDIHELHCQLIELVHLPTGAQVIHIANDDPENLFCLSFQTIPTTSNGVAHVLEHTVLCGSQKFPVKDPFFTMQRRSLNTFMNALTGADFTCYPASSQVPTDFYNLLDVYLDAVFHPNLNKLSFLQEGHRLEFANSTDPSSPLEYKGIVFNEMKGAMSGPSTRLNEAISQALFPDLTYGINSGGDPKKNVQEVLEISDEDFLKLYNLACEELNQTRYKVASDMFSLLSWINPKFYYNMINLGLAESLQGHHDEAKEIYEACLQITSDEQVLYLYAADNCNQMNDKDNASKFLEQSIALATAANDQECLQNAEQLRIKLL